MIEIELLTRVLAWLARPVTLNIAGFIVVLFYAMRIADIVGLDPRVMYWAGVWGVIGALWGGYLSHAASDIDAILAQPMTLFDFMHGHKGVFGAFLGAGIFGFSYLYLKNLSPLKYADAAVPAVALGYILARLACFTNGDDFGVVTDIPWGVEFGAGTDAYLAHLQRGWIGVTDQESLPVHPTQLYHAVAGLLGFLLLSRCRSVWPGRRLALGLIAYGVVRFFIQFVRDDHLVAELLLDRQQWFCLLFIAMGLLLHFRKRIGTTARQRQAVT